MYLEKLAVTNLRVFTRTEFDLWYPGRQVATKETKPALSNVNLLLGNNGAGKTTLMRAIALAALGPLADKFQPDRLVRNLKGPARRRSSTAVSKPDFAAIDATMRTNWQDRGTPPTLTKNEQLGNLESKLQVERYGDEEFVAWTFDAQSAALTSSKAIPRTSRRGAAFSTGSGWSAIQQADSPAFFTVGYGATRRTDSDANSPTPQQRLKSMPLRHQRVASLFYDNYSLVPLQIWLPALQVRSRTRFAEVLKLLNAVLPKEIRLTSQRANTDEFLFRQGKALVPFSSLSDGARAFIGWMADMLYHLQFSCPARVKLANLAGLILVDEVDLHLHPDWQRVVIPSLAKTFRKLQFVFTSHSPIVVGSLQKENLWVCEPNARKGASVVKQLGIPVHGLNSDHILLTPYFGLRSSRAPEKQLELDRLAAGAEKRSPDKALQFLHALVTPLEDLPGKQS